MAKILPPKWIDVYPRGTSMGDEEQGFFLALERHEEWKWRSTAHLAAEAGIDLVRCEEIISKYIAKGMVFQNPANEDQWGYWERLPHMLPDKDVSLSFLDHDRRIQQEMYE